jgi:hypothetical protein
VADLRDAGMPVDARVDAVPPDGGTVPPQILSHAEGAELTSFEETLTGTCDSTAPLMVGGGSGIEIVSSDCTADVLTVVVAVAPVGTTAEDRTVSVENGGTLVRTLRARAACPLGYSGVAADPVMGTDDFCISQYEMKKGVGGAIDADGNDPGGGCGEGWQPTWVAAAVADGMPWTCISQSQAIQSCNALGGGGFEHRLITNSQWQAAARNIESVPSNWTADGVLRQGNNGGFCSSDDVNACYGMGLKTNRSFDTNPIARLLLRNAGPVWDLSGNVWDWVDVDGAGGVVSLSGSATDMFIELDSAEAREFYSSLSGLSEPDFAPAGSYSGGTLSGRGLGAFYVCGGGLTDQVIARGGPAWSVEKVGVFAAVFCFDNTAIHNGVGFRCSSTVVLR